MKYILTIDTEKKKVFVNLDHPFFAYRLRVTYGA
jgi:hypothetical protein